MKITPCVNQSVGIVCGCCGYDFEICKSCWRNQKYCSVSCAKKSRQLRQRISQSKYRKTDKGIKTQARANRRYRLHLKIIVSEKTSKKDLRPVLPIKKKKACHCCSCETVLLKALNEHDHGPFSFQRFKKINKGEYDG